MDQEGDRRMPVWDMRWMRVEENRRWTKEGTRMLEGTGEGPKRQEVDQGGRHRRMAQGDRKMMGRDRRCTKVAGTERWTKGTGGWQ